MHYIGVEPISSTVSIQLCIDRSLHQIGIQLTMKEVVDLFDREFRIPHQIVVGDITDLHVGMVSHEDLEVLQITE